MRRRLFRILRFPAGITLALVPVLLFLSRPDSLPLPAKPAGALRVAAANLNYGNPRSSEVTHTLLSARPDILLLVEWTGANADSAAFRGAGYRLALHHPRSGTHGLALFVRSGIEVATRLHAAPVPGPCRLPYLAARLRVSPPTPAGAASSAAAAPSSAANAVPVPSRFFTFLGVHAPPPVPSCQGGNRPYLEALAALVSDGRLRQDLGPGRRGDPVLLAGDLNTMPASPALKAHHRAGLADGVRKARGRFLKPTWAPLAALPALIRIDTFLAGPDFRVHSAWTLDIPASDHRAVLADLSLSRP